MFSLESALSIYTDKLNAEEEINLDNFYKNLQMNDIDEFNEMIEVINLAASIPYTDKFMKLFEEINDYKEKLYSIDAAGNFRKDNNLAGSNEDAQRTLDSLFDEEFPDE